MIKQQFTEKLITWQKQHGRHHLPWQVSDPYCVWLSEIMLQQTQVSTVLNYYPRFLNAFPTVASLAAAPQDQVLNLWAGLGYYSRARNLHKAAQQIMQEFNGQFPQQREKLEKLIGVGRSTAAAIAAFAFQQREAILDGNVKRVLCRVFALDGDPSHKTFEQSLWSLAEQLLPTSNQDMPTYTQGLMDLGATICKRSKPFCNHCPMFEICQAKATNQIHELPRKKKPIQITQQTLYWLILRQANQSICIHKRPQKGIWAGLYCVPSFESQAQLHDWLTQHQLVATPSHRHSPINHRLTHRLLHIIPLEYTLLQTPVLLQSYLWLSPNQLNQYGLPKPLFTLLNDI